LLIEATSGDDAQAGGLARLNSLLKNSIARGSHSLSGLEPHPFKTKSKRDIFPQSREVMPFAFVKN